MTGSSGRASASGSVGAVAELLRPLNGLMASAAVVVGAYVSRWPTRWPEAVLGAVAAFAAAAGANALNDAADAEADAVNRPSRPVPSGRVSRRTAVAVAVAAWAVAGFAASLVGPRAALLVAAWIVVSAVYSPWIKRAAFAKDAVVAAVAASPFLLGGITQDKLLLSSVPFALAFLAHAARELVKDVQDREGDVRAGVRTAAAVVGEGATLAVSRVVIIVLMAVAALPYLAPRLMAPPDVHPVFGTLAGRFVQGVGYNWGYGALVAVADVLLIRVLFLTSGDTDAAALAKASRTLKAVMAVGIFAFVVGVMW
ncbi:MAG: hypothetical protein GF405_08035 [Candidatus Eisenbacteria bacterium]|nr:hypothetical protein [Candidatus Eisenbacteria bacterium]